MTITMDWPFLFFCVLLPLLVCALSGWSISYARGNAPAVGCVLGGLLGPIGLVILLVQGRNEHALQERALRRGDLIRCVRCAEVIQPTARQCPHCGQQYTSAQVRV